jgi:hypothetical protein
LKFCEDNQLITAISGQETHIKKNKTHNVSNMQDPTKFTAYLTAVMEETQGIQDFEKNMSDDVIRWWKKACKNSHYYDAKGKVISNNPAKVLNDFLLDSISIYYCGLISDNSDIVNDSTTAIQELIEKQSEPKKIFKPLRVQTKGRRIPTSSYQRASLSARNNTKTLDIESSSESDEDMPLHDLDGANAEPANLHVGDNTTSHSTNQATCTETTATTRVLRSSQLANHTACTETSDTTRVLRSSHLANQSSCTETSATTRMLRSSHGLSKEPRDLAIPSRRELTKRARDCAIDQMLEGARIIIHQEYKLCMENLYKKVAAGITEIKGLKQQLEEVEQQLEVANREITHGSSSLKEVHLTEKNSRKNLTINLFYFT